MVQIFGIKDWLLLFVVFDETEMMKSLDVGFNVTITQIAIIIMICD